MKKIFFTLGVIASTSASASLDAVPDPVTLTRSISISLDCANRLEPHDSYYGPLQEFKARHPVFFGCWDYHASAFNHWALLRVVNEWPDRPERNAIVSFLSKQFTRENLKTEAQNIQKDISVPLYEIGWVLQLADEIHQARFPEAKNWSQNFAPLESEALNVFREQLLKTSVPDRSPLHQNTAYALIHALDYARSSHQPELAQLILQRAREFFVADQDCQVPDESEAGPGGYVGAQFISQCFTEADLMRRVLAQGEFVDWYQKFFPHLPDDWLKPLAPMSNQYGFYRLGLMLSKAANFHGLARSTGDNRLLPAADVQTATAQATMFDQGYMGDHWLPAFYIYSLMHFGP
ncbi:MAG: DUF2891 family protein [Bdellovibrionota bacterium]